MAVIQVQRKDLEVLKQATTQAPCSSELNVMTPGRLQGFTEALITTQTWIRFPDPALEHISDQLAFVVIILSVLSKTSLVAAKKQLR